MPAFAILRFDKHRSTATIAAASGHMTRDRETANADPARRTENRVLVGGDASPADLADARHEAFTTGAGRPARANGVRAVEVFMGTSPEWHASASPADRAAWERQSQEWLQREFGTDNVVSLIAHHDERTPHLTGIVVPVDPDTGRLNASRWLDGAARLAKLQTGYAAAVADLGLERGAEGSTAKHQTVKQFYGALAADVGGVALPPVATPPINPLGRDEWARAETARLDKAIRPQVAALQMKARAGVATADRVKTLQADAEASRQLAARVREMPMTDVLTKLGLRPDKADPKQWIDPGEKRFRITLKERQFYDHSAAKGGGGAIDLAMHVLGSDFKQAVAWLGGAVGAPDAARAVAAHAVEQSRAVVAEAQAERPPFALPAVETDRDLVRGYLVGQRGLDAGLVDRLVDEGRIVTDERRNVGFVMHDEAGVPRGLELKGTDPARPFTGLAPGSTREATFRIGLDRERSGRPPRVVLTESAIDAMSYVQLHGGGGPCLVASTSGACPTLPDSLKKAVDAAPEVAVAFDNDGPGDNAAKRLLEALRGWYRGIRKRLLPRAGDWNDDLRGKPAVARPARERGTGIG